MFWCKNQACKKVGFKMQKLIANVNWNPTVEPNLNNFQRKCRKNAPRNIPNHNSAPKTKSWETKLGAILLDWKRRPPFAALLSDISAPIFWGVSIPAVNWYFWICELMLQDWWGGGRHQRSVKDTKWFWWDGLGRHTGSFSHRPYKEILNDRKMSEQTCFELWYWM